MTIGKTLERTILNNFSLSRRQVYAYAAPSLAFAWLIPPMYAIMADFYLRYTTATAAGIGTAMMFSKIIDAITDPPVGYWSDHTRTRWGARKPWLFAGMLAAIVMFVVFFNPPENAGNWYFTVGLVLYYIAYTLLAIPSRAWLGEITTNYEERSKVWSVYTIGLLVGGLLIMIIPILLSEVIPIFDSAEFDRDMIALLGWIGGVLLVITVAIALKFAPAGVRNEGEPPKITDFFSIVKNVPPFRIFLVGFGFSALGFGVFYAVIVVGLTSYFGFADRIAMFMLCMIGMQVSSIPLWERLARRIPKHKVWAYAWVTHACFAPTILLFSEHSEYFWLFVALAGTMSMLQAPHMLLMSMLQAPHMLFPTSVMSDIVDYDTWKHQTSRSGNFFALLTFIDKVLHALGFAIGYYILAVFGYDAKAVHNSDFAVMGLYTAIVFVPSALFICSAFCLNRFPIDSHKHRIIRRAISRHELRAG